MEPSKECARFIQLRESCTLYVKIVSGNPTIGWGHNIKKFGYDATMLKKGFRLTQEQADALFMQDLRSHAKLVNDKLKISLSQHQFDALVSITYNFGHVPSGLIRYVNLGFPVATVAQMFNTYTQSAGSFLRKCRKAEAHLYAIGEYKNPQSFKA